MFRKRFLSNVERRVYKVGVRYSLTLSREICRMGWLEGLIEAEDDAFAHNSLQINNDFFQLAAEYGNVRIMQYLREYSVDEFSNAMRLSALNNHLNVMIWIAKTWPRRVGRKPISAEAREERQWLMKYVIENDLLRALLLLIRWDTKIDYSHVELATKFNSTKMMKLLNKSSFLEKSLQKESFF